MATPLPSNRARFDARGAAAAARGRVVLATQGRVAVGVTSDSRAVTPGCAFVALRGETHDGHAFVSAAIESGAVLVVVGHGRAPRDARADVVEADDTLEAWGALARDHLRAYRARQAHARVVAITGSTGKTTTKELCAALLRTAGECHATTGNLNNRVGVPAVAFAVEARHRFAVLEMGMSVPGELEKLAAIAEPDVAVVTNVGLAHAGGVGGGIGDVAREKGALFAGATARGAIVVANADDPNVVAQTARAPKSARLVTFGRGDRADVRLESRVPLGIGGSKVTVRGRAFALPLPGDAAAVDFVAALAAAEAAVGSPLDAAKIDSALASLAPIAGRMHARRLRDGVTLLDDAYNANPQSVRAALSTLGEVDALRRIAVLGEMKELGPCAEREHEALGAAVADARVALLVSCGGLADVIARSASALGTQVVFARDAEDAAGIVLDRVRPGDAVLVKASRSVGAERVVDALVRVRGEEPR